MSESDNNNVPGFLLKLQDLLEAPKFQELVWWSGDGESFVIKDPTQFTRVVLPAYFKHSNFQSFVRQLNMYGFRRVVIFNEHIANITHESVAFFHKFFIKSRPDLLPLIKRKTTDSKRRDEIMDEINDVKQTQTEHNKSIFSLKRENEDLWREVVSLRQKHSHQEKIMNHVIKFLLKVVQHKGKGPKRKLPLMIEEPSETDLAFKVPRTNQSSPASAPNGKSNSLSVDNADRLLLTEIQSSSSNTNNSSHTACENLQYVSSENLFEADKEDQFPIFNESTSLENDVNDSLKQSAASSANNRHDHAACDSSETIADKISANFDSPPYTTTDMSFDSSNTFLESFTDTSSSSNILNDENEPGCSYKSSSPVENFNSGTFRKNLQYLQDKLTNKEPVHLDCELMEELFYGSIDLSSHARFFDESLFSVPPPPITGHEMVQYSSDNTRSVSSNNTSKENSGKVDFGELFKLLNE